jgi:2-dehydro-3-deoxygalactonokinase
MKQNFLSCDWGTSTFRLRLIGATTRQVLAVSNSDEGVAQVHQSWQQAGADEQVRLHFYRSVLHRHIKSMEAELGTSLSSLVLVVSGMASSTIGLKELPYKHLPFSVTSMDFGYERIEGDAQFGHDIMLISGARTERDVMRGEETQLAGCIQDDGASGLFIFPGTHSKHIVVANGHAVSFRTYMTGEFFNLLAEKSILSKSVMPSSTLENTVNRTAFEAGVNDSQNENLLHTCFMVRTNDLFARYGKEANYWYLSGLVIGAEMSNLTKSEIQQITLVGGAQIADAYRLALTSIDPTIHVAMVDVHEALVKSHVAIFKALS